MNATLESIRLDAGYNIACEGNSKVVAYTKAVLAHVEALCLANTCVVAGHALEDDSVAGPDHGTMACYCTRCGWSQSTTLY